jgi:glycerophosphoryl diester phosphodiesterase
LASIFPAIAYPRIIAHRCGGALAPENTLAGLRIAARMGCRGVEFDVALTADGIPVLLHDETLDRTTNGTGLLACTASNTLARLDAGSNYHPAFAGESVPTFQSALAVCAELGLWVNVEIKPTSGTEIETGRAVASMVTNAMPNLIEQRGGPNTLLFSSFSIPALQAARHIAPTIPRALLTESITDNWHALCQAAGACALHTAAKGITQAQITSVCNSGIPIACYTVNDRATAAGLFAAGIKAIFTDRIDLWLPDNL